MEALVTEKIEAELRKIPEIDEIKSTSSAGVSSGTGKQPGSLQNSGQGCGGGGSGALPDLGAIRAATAGRF